MNPEYFINEAFASSKEEKLEAFRIVLGLLAETKKHAKQPGLCNQTMEILMAMHDAIEEMP